MSDNDFIIIDEEKETPVTTEGKESPDIEKKEVSQTSVKEEHEDEYEKICFICHRPESVTGKMIDLPNHITVCPDCMQKSFDAMTNGSIDYSRLMNMPGVQFLNLSDLENMAPPKTQKIKKKKKSQKSSKNWILRIFRRRTRSKESWMSMWWGRSMPRKRWLLPFTTTIRE